MNKGINNHPFELQIKNGNYYYSLPKSTLEIVLMICNDYVNSNREYFGDDSLEYIVSGCSVIILYDTLCTWLKRTVIKEFKRSDFPNNLRSARAIRNSVKVSFSRSELAAVTSAINEAYCLGNVCEHTMSELSILNMDIHKILINGVFPTVNTNQNA